MAADSRRKSSPRKRSSRAKTNHVTFAGVPTWLDETLAAGFCAVALFFLVSIVSYRINGAQILQRANVAELNLLGPLGHVTATIVFGALGWASMGIVVYLGYLAAFFWRHGDLLPGTYQWPRPLVALGLGGMLVASATFGASIAGNLGGGSLGFAVTSFLGRSIGAPGAALFSVALMLCSVAFATRRGVFEVLRFLAVIVFRTLMILGVALPFYLWRAGAAGLHAIGMVVDWLWGRRPEAEQRAEDRRRDRERREDLRRTRDSEEVESEDLDDELDEADEIAARPEERTLVVVQRRSGPGDVSNAAATKATAKGDRTTKRRTVVSPTEPDADPFASYVPPALDLLVAGEPSVGGENDQELRDKSKLIESKLRDFGVLGKVTHVHPGPVITLFEFEPAPGIKVGKVVALQDDLAMSLRATSIRVIAPIPRRGTVGIEVPNRNRDVVRLRDVLESKAFQESESTLSVPLGKDTYGDPLIVDIASMPHLLMAGTTGTGKSVCINSILVSLLYRASPAELGLILIDPKVLELSIYEGVPHLRVPVVTIPKQAKAVLDWAVTEMNRRYRYMQRFNVRNIDSYNRIVSGDTSEGTMAWNSPAKPLPDVIPLEETQVIESGTVEPGVDSGPDRGTVLSNSIEAHQATLFKEELKPLPKIVIVVDELADLILTVGRDIEEQITKLAQKARAAGIHLILATQRPSVDVVTGLIKANFPARISFRVSSRIDSRTILDSMGAERLLGRGDMLFLQPGAESLRRVHGAFVSDAEVGRVVESLKKSCPPQYDQRILDICERALLEDKNDSPGGEGSEAEEYDEMYDKAVEFVVQRGQASTSMLQRAFRIGYNRAARLVDKMEREGVVGPMDGARPRDVLVPSTPSESVIGSKVQ